MQIDRRTNRKQLARVFAALAFPLLRLEVSSLRTQSLLLSACERVLAREQPRVLHLILLLCGVFKESLTVTDSTAATSVIDTCSSGVTGNAPFLSCFLLCVLSLSWERIAFHKY